MKIFYKGLVEDNNDPEKIGRCRIRIFGLHSQKKIIGETEGIQTNHLPWANPAWPINFSSTSGVGFWSVPVQGTWVWVFFEDDNFQDPIYFASLSGISRKKANINIGFNDPEGTYPLETRLNEGDYNRLASVRNEESTIQKVKKDEIITNIITKQISLSFSSVDDYSIFDDEIKYSESNDIYSPSYPLNKVMETEPKKYISGHILEFDDTEEKERLHIYHKKGSSFLFNWNGDLIEKIRNDKYTFSLRRMYRYVNNDDLTHIWGDYFKLIRCDSHVEIYGNEEKYVKGDKKEFISGDINRWVGAELVDNPVKSNFTNISRKNDGSLDEIEEKEVPNIQDIGGTVNEVIEKNVRRDVKGNKYEEVYGTVFVEVTGSSSITEHKVGDSGDFKIKSHGETFLQALKMVRVWGCRYGINAGVITGKTICPYTISPHSFSSRTVKATL